MEGAGVAVLDNGSVGFSDNSCGGGRARHRHPATSSRWPQSAAPIAGEEAFNALKRQRDL
jgi:hypothetical protein